jgi:hypothetical protein
MGKWFENLSKFLSVGTPHERHLPASKLSRTQNFAFKRRPISPTGQSPPADSPVRHNALAGNMSRDPQG